MGNIEGSSSRPSISFPLGLALLIITLVCISAFICCCYNWNKVRSLLQSSVSDTDDNQSDASRSQPNAVEKAELHNDQSLTVVMPGEETPKFLAFPAPRVEKNAQV